jgi:hypothetical protein
MTNTRIFGLMALIALAIGACKKDSEAPVSDPAGTSPANISLDFHFMKGANPFTLDSVVADSLGRAVKLSTCKFFVSGTHAEDDYEQHVGEWPTVYLLVDASHPANTFAMGTMAAAHVHQFHFDLGLDSTTNHADPTLANAPLNDASMHWAWNPAQGYKFLVAEGHVDDDGDGLVDNTDPEFIYHCATDALLGEAHAHEHHDVVAGENYVAPILIDVAQLFAGISVLDTLNAMGGTPTNVRLMNNLSSAIDGVE